MTTDRKIEDGAGHWSGCWREPGHHECAIAVVDELMLLLVRAQIDLAAHINPTPDRSESHEA